MSEQDSGATQTRTQVTSMKYLIRALIKYGASDLHLKPERPPLFRIHGKLIPAKLEALKKDQVLTLVEPYLSDAHQETLRIKKQVDLSFMVEGVGRFRCHLFYQKSGLSAAIRMVPLIIPRFQDLGLPKVLADLSHRDMGLLLVTGPTGSGKSTTLASLINAINESQSLHIITIEDPIEFVHRDLKSSVSQREVGSDVLGYHEGLMGALRQDPDVLMIGELRDRETIQTALTAAETGHLVIATLHTNDARGTIDRIVDVFPPEARPQVRIQLASSLVGVISQRLIVRADQTGRIVATEVMVNSPTIEQMILRNELDKIPEAIAQSNHYYQMHTLNQCLKSLVEGRLINQEDALKCSNSPDDLKLAFSGLTREQGFRSAG